MIQQNAKMFRRPLQQFLEIAQGRAPNQDQGLTLCLSRFAVALAALLLPAVSFGADGGVKYEMLQPQEGYPPYNPQSVCYDINRLPERDLDLDNPAIGSDGFLSFRLFANREEAGVAIDRLLVPGTRLADLDRIVPSDTKVGPDGPRLFSLGLCLDHTLDAASVYKDSEGGIYLYYVLREALNDDQANLWIIELMATIGGLITATDVHLYYDDKVWSDRLLPLDFQRFNADDLGPLLLQHLERGATVKEVKAFMSPYFGQTDPLVESIEPDGKIELVYTMTRQMRDLRFYKNVLPSTFMILKWVFDSNGRLIDVTGP